MQAKPVLRNELLPPEISVSSGTWFGRARSYPIFSPAWYRYRSLAVLTGSALVFLVLAAMLGVPMVNAPSVAIDWVTVAEVTGLIAAPYCALCLAGPGLAVVIRRLGLRLRLETAAILTALLLGMGLSVALLIVLASAYERPRFDIPSDTLVARSLPRFQVMVQVTRGAITIFDGQRKDKGIRQSPEVERAIEAVSAAQIAALAKLSEGKAAVPQDQGFAYLGREAQLAIQTMQQLDAGDLAADPARRREIEMNYAAAIEKMYQMQPGVPAAAIAASHGRLTTPEETTAAQRLGAAMTAQAMAQFQEPARSAAPDAFSKELGKLSVALIGMAALLLAAWLGGLFELRAFVRQRGKLVEVLHREELKRAQAARNSAEMRLSVLAAQVEPHFLFNTLASVRSAISTDPQRATQIVDHMVDFLRSTIPQMRDDAACASVRLSTQMDAARSYLALMHERIPRLQFDIAIEPGLEHALIPPLMLISLVENAVKHGVEPKIGPARIAVRARRVDVPELLLELCVSDDGVGFGEASSGDGIGLTNIQERLRSYFGTRASLMLKALPEGGVAAILRLPLSFES